MSFSVNLYGNGRTLTTEVKENIAQGHSWVSITCKGDGQTSSFTLHATPLQMLEVAAAITDGAAKVLARQEEWRRKMDEAARGVTTDDE